jgi:enterochelin esterase-like enzyme
VTGQFESEGIPAAGVDLGSFPQAGVAVVFGASGGIGRALVEAIKAAEQFKHVVSVQPQHFTSDRPSGRRQSRTCRGVRRRSG